jgi:hypothetical protein
MQNALCPDQIGLKLRPQRIAQPTDTGNLFTAFAYNGIIHCDGYRFALGKLLKHFAKELAK